MCLPTCWKGKTWQNDENGHNGRLSATGWAGTKALWMRRLFWHDGSGVEDADLLDKVLAACEPKKKKTQILSPGIELG